MSALDTLERIIVNPNLMEHDFRYCLVKGKDKVPYSFKGHLAHPNNEDDFCSLEELSSVEHLEKYEGIGISIIGSNVCAIDVDKCFSIPFVLDSGDDRAKDTLETFKDKAYIEFSFSGKGLRVLFKVDNIPDYTKTYYIKNDKTGIEYYQPGNTPRYVTITGKVIFDNSLSKMTNLDTIYGFLNKYMIRPKTFVKKLKNNDILQNNELSFDELMKKVKSLYLKDIEFQNLWFGVAPGSGKNESQLDFHLISILFENITDDKEMLKTLFENSPYFATKDKKHLNKWYYGNNRYFEYIYEHL